MPYTAKQQLDLIKANKLEIIDKINELLGSDSGLTWDSSWTQFLTKINEIKTNLPIENDQIITEIEHFIANQSINSIAIASDKIKENAFRQKSSLLTIDAPNVEHIEARAFNAATGLLSIAAPNCTSIGDYAFSGCSLLDHAIFNSNYNISAYAFNDCIKLATISSSLTTIIPDYAFCNCNNLNIDSTTFPNAKSVGSYAFNSCKKLATFNFNGVTSISTYAFQNCTMLTELDLTGCSANINQYAFQNCSNVTKIIIPMTIAGIQSRAFIGQNPDCVIYCEQEQKPSNWNNNWNYNGYPVYWNAKLRDYTFVLNNGEPDIVKNLRAVLETDLPIIEKEGYLFDNWYTDIEFAHKLKCPYISETNLQLYARWLRGYTVIFVDYQTFEQVDAGTYYYSSLSDIPIYWYINNTAYTAVGAYLDTNCTELITVLDDTHVVNPIIYLKTTPGTTYKEIKNFDCTEVSEQYLLMPGEHVIECWGAQGGNPQNSFNYGLGGYSYGTLTLANAANIFVRVGGQGKYSAVNSVNHLDGGFNGGGSCYSYDGYYHAGSGGGASDIRINEDSLYSRLIVAGGGGGNGIAGSTYFRGGAGGGLVGQAGEQSGQYTGGGGGTQTAGGSKGSNSSSSYAGTFGVGGQQTGNSGGWCGCGGGGGWYGGGSGGAVAAGGGGGSGYVYTLNTAADYPSGCTLNQNYYLTNAETISGNTEFESPTGELETGHSGNGYIRITSIIRGTSQPIICTVKLVGITSTGESVNLTTIDFDHNIRSVDLPTKMVGWLISDWYADIDRTIKITFPYEIILNGELTLYTDVEEYLVYDINYTGDVEQVTLTPGKYKLECWGAQGGGTNGTPGKGGYSTGVLNLNNVTQLSVYVGGQGTASRTASLYGGWNGGGGIYAYVLPSSDWKFGTGGGASDIALHGETCITDNFYRYTRTSSSYLSRIIVAGGGGGTCINNSPVGGYGGGSSGGIGSGDNPRPTAATQTSAGSNCGYAAAGFGFGASGKVYSTGTTQSAGGGGGWYGGGNSTSSNNVSAGGGSGYVYTAETATDYPAGCLLNSDYYLTDARTVAGNETFLSPTGSNETGHTGNGYVRITKIRSN